MQKLLLLLLKITTIRTITVNGNSYKLASFGSRVLARLIDFVILIIPSLMILSFRDPYMNIGILIFWMYYSFLWAGKYQASVGQKMCNIILVRTSEKRIGWGFATGRHFMSIFAAVLCFISLPMFFLTKRRQFLHDYVFGTVAVSLDSL